MNLTCIRLDTARHYHTHRSNRGFNRESNSLPPTNWAPISRGVPFWLHQLSHMSQSATCSASNLERGSTAAQSRKGEAVVVTVDLETSAASGVRPANQGLQHTRTSGSAPRTWSKLAQSTAGNQQRNSCLQQIVVLTFNVLADGLDVHGDFVKVMHYDTTYVCLLAISIEVLISIYVASLHDMFRSPSTDQSHSPHLKLH